MAHAVGSGLRSLRHTQCSTACVCEADRTAATAVIVQLVQIARADIDYSRVEWGIFMHLAAYLGMLPFVRGWSMPVLTSILEVAVLVLR
jgi:hypothetical protein